MNYFRHQDYFASYSVGSSKLLAGFVLVSLGVLLAAAGGSWDITNHLLNKPETFFAPPHAVLYSGAASAIVGAVLLFSASKKSTATNKKMVWQVKLVIAGVVMLIGAAPADFAWHSAFGLDGLLSPPHFVLVSGMIVSSVGALAGLAQSTKRLPSVIIVIAILPIWLAASGMIDMFSLPFSETTYFNFNPHPALGVAVATLAFPFLISACMICSSSLADKRFGVLSITGASFILIGVLTSIIPNNALIPTIPFYISGIIPIVAADTLLAFSRSRLSLYAAGIIIGLVFFMLYYPLITYTYNEVFERKAVWPSLIVTTYFEMIQDVFLFGALPAAAMGVIGALVSDRLVRNRKIYLNIQRYNTSKVIS